MKNRTTYLHNFLTCFIIICAILSVFLPVSIEALEDRETSEVSSQKQPQRLFSLAFQPALKSLATSLKTSLSKAVKLRQVCLEQNPSPKNFGYSIFKTPEGQATLQNIKHILDRLSFIFDETIVKSGNFLKRPIEYVMDVPLDETIRFLRLPKIISIPSPNTNLSCKNILLSTLSSEEKRALPKNHMLGVYLYWDIDFKSDLSGPDDKRSIESIDRMQNYEGCYDPTSFSISRLSTRLEGRQGRFDERLDGRILWDECLVWPFR